MGTAADVHPDRTVLTPCISPGFPPMLSPQFTHAQQAHTLCSLLAVDVAVAPTKRQWLPFLFLCVLSPASVLLPTTFWLPVNISLSTPTLGFWLQLWQRSDRANLLTSRGSYLQQTLSFSLLGWWMGREGEMKLSAYSLWK